MNIRCFLVLLLSWIACSPLLSGDQPEPADDPVKELPKVLIIGDSISIGYTPFVEEQLREKAMVIHNPGNAQHTGTGLKKIDAWLGEKKWDVIHFNWGLWDLCYRDPPGSLKRGKKNGKVTFTPQQYGKNLEKLIVRLKKTGAKLIWASTTKVPEGEPGRKVGDDIRYNAVARKLMKKYRIPVTDLHAASSQFPAELFRAPGDVHFKPEGRRKLARLVAKKVEEALEK
ncbi:MAG: SGNH/GDSL hydrolase family protein [Planctomycetota bacterium]|nr:SGNH/GDSL hydrolase family protein [Planctomycetota bacterium]